MKIAGILTLIIGILGLGYFLIFKKPREITVLSWDNYIGKNTLGEFAKKTKINVKYGLIKSNEEALDKIKTDPEAYDVVVVSDYMVKIMKSEGLIQPLDRKVLTNLKNINEDFKGAYYDSGLEFSVPYTFGTAGFAVNKKYYKEGTISWKELTKAKYKGKIIVMDNMRYVLGSVLLELGYDPNTTNKDEIGKAVALFKKVLPNIERLNPDTPTDLMIDEKAWVTYDYSNGVLQMQAQNKNIGYLVPSYGALKFVDSMVLMKESKKNEEALAYINYILEPEVSAGITNQIHYGNPNGAARSLINPEILSNPTVFNDSEMSKKLRFVEEVGDALNLYNDAWEEIKL